VETLFMLSVSGFLAPGDLSVIIGAENIHRAQPFKPLDTSNLIFGDDALATVLETGDRAESAGGGEILTESRVEVGGDFVAALAEKIAEWAREGHLDGIIVDNQLSKDQYRIPATAARVQHAVVERLFPEETASGLFQNFRAALEFYDSHEMGFAFDVMTLDSDP